LISEINDDIHVVRSSVIEIVFQGQKNIDFRNQ